VIRFGLVAAVFGVAIGISAATASPTSVDPKAMVLRLNDLPAGFGRDEGHYVSNVRAARESEGVSLADYIRWGRITGYEANFSRSAIVGLIKVASDANTYRSVRGARDSLHDSFRSATQPNKAGFKFRRLSTGGPIGHESRLYTFRTKSGGYTIDGYFVIWRYFAVRASVLGGGIAGTVRP
jgi:hypothetical protein